MKLKWSRETMKFVQDQRENRVQVNGVAAHGGVEWNGGGREIGK